VVIAMHVFEDRKSSNTGRLATHCLRNSEVVLHGREGEPGLELGSFPDTEPLILFPARGARPIEEFRGSPGPFTLVVPDGTWRQANRLKNRLLRQRNMPCAFAPLGAPSSYKLRSAGREAALSTIEAVARALGVLEGAPVEQELLGVFRIFVERSLVARSGQTPPAKLLTPGSPNFESTSTRKTAVS
jgi:DTW domain-containing protein YfiP